MRPLKFMEMPEFNPTLVTCLHCGEQGYSVLIIARIPPRI